MRTGRGVIGGGRRAAEEALIAAQARQRRRSPGPKALRLRWDLSSLPGRPPPAPRDRQSAASSHRPRPL